MKKLLSLPPNLVKKGVKQATVFHDITRLPTHDYFCTCDPEGHRVGSGGGTAWLLQQCYAHEHPHETEPSSDRLGEQCETATSFHQWLASEKRILIHAGGQSRRLPSYAPSGKILTPIPVFRWERGQRLSQDLLQLQLPLYERIMQMAPDSLHTMVVSGDVLIRVGGTQASTLPPLPQADVVCFGLWLDDTIACHHGIFVADRHTPQTLKQMVQKPTMEKLSELKRQHLYLTDIGVWLFSDRAISLLMKRCGVDVGSSLSTSAPQCYDLYSEFGRSLGTHPELSDAELSQLHVAIVPLTDGEFYHFGTSAEMISSMVRIQNRVSDQRRIMHHDRKPHPSIFVQNTELHISFTAQNTNVWIENSCIGPRWTLTHDNIVTGVPVNDWQVRLDSGQCIDIVPIGANDYAVRRYHITDRFDGAEQQRPQFPIMSLEEIGTWIENRGNEPGGASETAGANDSQYPLLSAEQLSAQANLYRLFAQREAFRNANWPTLAANWEHSVFYQLDLDDAACSFQHGDIPLPAPLPTDAPLMTRIHDAMFRGQRNEAFALLRQGVINQIDTDLSLIHI